MACSGETQERGEEHRSVCHCVRLYSTYADVDTKKRVFMLHGEEWLSIRSCNAATFPAAARLFARVADNGRHTEVILQHTSSPCLSMGPGGHAHTLQRVTKSALHSVRCQCTATRGGVGAKLLRQLAPLAHAMTAQYRGYGRVRSTNI